jgi:hypothetical protein
MNVLVVLLELSYNFVPYALMKFLSMNANVMLIRWFSLVYMTMCVELRVKHLLNGLLF